MPKLAMSVPHTLGQEEATQRVKGLLEKVKSRYQGQVSDLHEEWGDHSGQFSFKTFGFNIKGQVAVEPSEVKVEGELPFAAMMFKAKIEQTIREQLDRLMG
jgi:hypothetical protein